MKETAQNSQPTTSSSTSHGKQNAVQLQTTSSSSTDTSPMKECAMDPMLAQLNDQPSVLDGPSALQSSDKNWATADSDATVSAKESDDEQYDSPESPGTLVTCSLDPCLHYTRINKGILIFHSVILLTIRWNPMSFRICLKRRQRLL